jgi:hypothetical protein
MCSAHKGMSWFFEGIMLEKVTFMPEISCIAEFADRQFFKYLKTYHFMYLYILGPDERDSILPWIVFT